MDNNPYFPSRTFVGQRFAHELSELRYYNTAVIALSPGAALIAIEIARRTYSPIGLLLTKNVMLPDNATSFGVMSSTGGFTHEIGMEKPQIEDFEMEYRNAIEHNKMMAMHDLNIVGHRVLLDPHFCTQRRVIIVNDMTQTATDFKAALDFLHAIRTERMILVSAVAKLDAYYSMQELGDEAHVAHTTDKDFPLEHYFGDTTVPDTATLLGMMETVLD